MTWRMDGTLCSRCLLESFKMPSLSIFPPRIFKRNCLLYRNTEESCAEVKQMCQPVLCMKRQVTVDCLKSVEVLGTVPGLFWFPEISLHGNSLLATRPNIRSFVLKNWRNLAGPIRRWSFRLFLFSKTKKTPEAIKFPLIKQRLIQRRMTLKL